MPPLGGTDYSDETSSITVIRENPITVISVQGTVDASDKTADDGDDAA